MNFLNYLNNTNFDESCILLLKSLPWLPIYFRLKLTPLSVFNTPYHFLSYISYHSLTNPQALWSSFCSSVFIPTYPQTSGALCPSKNTSIPKHFHLVQSPRTPFTPCLSGCFLLVPLLAFLPLGLHMLLYLGLILDYPLPTTNVSLALTALDNIDVMDWIVSQTVSHNLKLTS